VLRSDNVEQFIFAADLCTVLTIFLDELLESARLSGAAIFDTSTLIAVNLFALLGSIVSSALLVGLEKFFDLSVVNLVFAFLVEA